MNSEYTMPAVGHSLMHERVNFYSPSAPEFSSMPGLDQEDGALFGLSPPIDYGQTQPQPIYTSTPHRRYYLHAHVL